MEVYGKMLFVNMLNVVDFNSLSKSNDAWSWLSFDMSNLWDSMNNSDSCTDSFLISFSPIYEKKRRILSLP